jgi:hypothetical protein
VIDAREGTVGELMPIPAHTALGQKEKSR